MGWQWKSALKIVDSFTYPRFGGICDIFWYHRSSGESFSADSVYLCQQRKSVFLAMLGQWHHSKSTADKIIRISLLHNFSHIISIEEMSWICFVLISILSSMHYLWLDWECMDHRPIVSATLANFDRLQLS